MPSTTASSDPATRTALGVGSSWLRRVLVLNLVAQVGIVVTGGLVRLTGSGLGCPTWPECTPGSYTPVVESSAGIHPYIEFGNRLLTFVVGAAIIATILALRAWAPHRRHLQRYAWVILAGVAVQAVVGGITVLTGLHPATVAFHFLNSMVLIALSAALVWREREGDGPPRPLVPGPVRWVGWSTAGVLGVVLLLGTVVTGSGPHSGDADEPARFGFDPRTISWLHADAVMLFTGLVIAVLLAVHLTSGTGVPRQAWRAVLVVTVLQGAIGYTQYATDLPEALVLLHMLGASLLTVAVTFGVLSLRARAAPVR